ncbi:MAG: hypothetical protein HYV08_00275 [Deltaproteobacteria bacterium]|nr:hypothetical protein [Deltaproteobacteria bacterium]
MGVLLLMVVLLAVPLAYADSWLLPETRDYYSRNRVFRFTVIPRSLRSQLDYFSDKAAGREPAGTLSEGQPVATGILSRRTGEGAYEIVWRRTLSNDVAPVNVLVSASGQYVVTFDNWHRVGHGKNTVVIYGPGGRLIREFALRDLMSEQEVRELPRSVSSIWWGRGHYLDQDETFLVLRIVSNGKMPHQEEARFRLLRIELSTGKIERHAGGSGG